MTVQLLQDSLAVFTLGKIAEEHGYSYEWATCQQPQQTKQGKTIICRTDNFVPFVFASVSENSGIASTSSSQVQDLPSSSSIKERSNESAPGNRCEAHTKQPKTKIKRRMTIEIGTKVCEISTEMPVLAHISQDSDSEHPTRVV